MIFNQPYSDDQLHADYCPDFKGGMVSNARSNLLGTNQCSYLENFDIDLSGQLITRRGIKQIGDNLGELIQGIAYYKTPTSAELIVAVGGILRAFNGTVWALAGGTSNLISPYVPAIFVEGIDILYIAQSDSGLQFYQNGFVQTYPNIAVSEITYVQNGALGITSRTPSELAGKYLLIHDEVGSVSVWFNVDGGNSDPATGARSIEVDILSTDSRDQAMEKMIAAVDADPKFTATVFDTVSYGEGAYIICVEPGARTDATAGNTHLVVGVNIPGRDLNQQPPVNISLLVWHTDRLIGSGVSTAPDTVYFSQFQDGSLWDRLNWSIRVGSGDGDPITALVPWTNYNLLVIKQHSIWVVNCNPTQAVTNFTIQRIHDRIGSFAPNTWCQVGTDIFGLTDSGVRSIRAIIASEQQKEVGPPLSYNVQDILDRLNKEAAHTSCAFHWNNRYILAVPLDGAAQPNYVLVFNTNQESWSGIWTGWLPTYFTGRLDSGAPKLCFSGSDGSVSDWMDYIPFSQETRQAFLDHGQDIMCKLITRSMTWNDPACTKTGMNCELEFDKSMADAVVQVILDDTAPQAFERFPTLQNALTLPLTLPTTLPKAGIVRKPFDLMRYDPWRELQFQVQGFSNKLALRSIGASAFINTLTLQ